MKKKDKKATKISDCYFQSDEDEEFSEKEYQQQKRQQLQMETQNQEQIKEISPKDIEVLNRMQIFQMFYECESLKQIISKNLYNLAIINKLYWRIQYILGEIIIMVQDFLISQNYLSDSLKMGIKDIQYICDKLIDESENQEFKEDFKSIKKVMWQLYKLNILDTNLAIAMYNYCAKIWKKPLNFCLDFGNTENKQKSKNSNRLQGVTNLSGSQQIPAVSTILDFKSQQPKPIPIINSPISIKTADTSPSSFIPTSRIGPFTVTRMQTQIAPLPPKNNQNTNNKKNKYRFQIPKDANLNASNMNSNSQNSKFINQPVLQQTQKDAIFYEANDPICMKTSNHLENQKPKQIQASKNYISFSPQDNNPIKKWTSREQAMFCQIYSKTDTAISCQHQLEQLMGSDIRWKNVTLIESKMRSLVNKVFNKFASFQTKNESIHAFKENRRTVMQCSNEFLRRCIYKHIAVMYVSMLYVNQSKKQQISRRMIEVNKLCKRFNELQS